ncbi:MAG: hypothetical protein R3C14_36445 [Caldilineaceae bacterium]
MAVPGCAFPIGSGFVDLYLEPFLARYPEIRYGYLIELEHISETQFNKKEFDHSLTAEKAEAAPSGPPQLRQYANDTLIQQVAQQVTLKKLVLIYKGWELVYAAEIGRLTGAKRALAGRPLAPI